MIKSNRCRRRSTNSDFIPAQCDIFWGTEMTFDTALAAMLRRKVAWRIMPLVILLYLVAYLDRANVGFASRSRSDRSHTLTRFVE